MNDVVNWEAETEDDSNVADASLGTVGKLANKMAEIELAIETKKKAVKELEAEFRKIQEHDLPDAMDEIGLPLIGLPDGRSIEVEEFVTGSISKANEEKAFGWMRSHGSGSLIKCEASVSLGPDSEKLLALFIEEMGERGLKVKGKASVHWATLRSYLKEQLELDDPNFPDEAFAVYNVRKAQIKTK